MGASGGGSGIAAGRAARSLSLGPRASLLTTGCNIASYSNPDTGNCGTASCGKATNRPSGGGSCSTPRALPRAVGRSRNSESDEEATEMMGAETAEERKSSRWNSRSSARMTRRAK